MSIARLERISWLLALPLLLWGAGAVPVAAGASAPELLENGESPEGVTWPPESRGRPLIRKILNETFYCGFDWDRDGSTTNDADDIVLCLDAAKTHAGLREDGSDRSVVVQLPSGVFDICEATTCPYHLQGGISIRGTNARAESDPTTKPTASMRMNGGTWLRGTTSDTIFYGENILNLELRDLGFIRFKVALHFGGDDVMGASWSRFQNLFFNAQCTGTCDSTGILHYNGLKNVIDGVFGRSMTRGLRIISQNDLVQPSNLIVNSANFVCHIDLPNQGCIEVTLEPGAETGCSQNQNFVTFLRPEVHVVTSLEEAAPGSAGMRFANHPDCFATQNISFMTVIGADIEARSAECSFQLIDTAASRFELAGANPEGTDYEFCVDANSRFNTLTSSYDGARARIDDTTSMLFGQFRSIERSDGSPAIFGGIVQDTTRVRQSIVLGGRPLWWAGSGWHVADVFPPPENGSGVQTLVTTGAVAQASALSVSGQSPGVRPEHWHLAEGSSTGPERPWTVGQAERDSVWLFPLRVERRTEFDKIGIAVSAAGRTGERIRLGVYAAEPSGNVVPGARLHSSAAVAPDASGDLTIPIPSAPLILDPGWYYLALQLDGAPSAGYAARAAAGRCRMGRKSLSDPSTCAVGLRSVVDFDAGLPERWDAPFESVAGPVATLGLRAR